MPSFKVDKVRSRRQPRHTPPGVGNVPGTQLPHRYRLRPGLCSTTTAPTACPRSTARSPRRFLCIIPRAARTKAGSAVVYGHGLLGSRDEVNSFGGFTNLGDITLCGTDIVGMASEDVGNVVQILQDNSKFATLADRLQQAILNYQFLARLMKDGARLRQLTRLPGRLAGPLRCSTPATSPTTATVRAASSVARSPQSRRSGRAPCSVCRA